MNKNIQYLPNHHPADSFFPTQPSLGKLDKLFMNIHPLWNITNRR